MKQLKTLVTMGIVLLAASFAQADVINGDFETGGFDGWSLSSNDDGFSFVGTDNPHAGTFGAELGQFSADGALALTQSIATTVGTTYTFSFWMTTQGGGFNSGAPDHFAALFGGQTVLNLTDVADPTTYTLFSFSVVATSSSTVVEFDSYDDPWFLFLDDVHVTASVVPEPSTIILFGVGACGLGLRRRIRRRRACPPSS
jgi:flagellin